jgi:hypothetical protein
VSEEKDYFFNQLNKKSFSNIDDLLNGTLDAPQREPSWEERRPDAAINQIEQYFVCPDFSAGDLVSLQGKILKSGQEIFASFTAIPIYDAPFFPKTPMPSLDHLLIINTEEELGGDLFQANPGDWLIIRNNAVIEVLETD